MDTYQFGTSQIREKMEQKNFFFFLCASTVVKFKLVTLEVNVTAFELSYAFILYPFFFFFLFDFPLHFRKFGNPHSPK